jgi:hypothetical protein
MARVKRRGDQIATFELAFRLATFELAFLLATFELAFRLEPSSNDRLTGRHFGESS